MTAEQCRLHTSPLWAAAASMDASLLGDCWVSLAIACPNAHMPLQPLQQGSVAMDTPGRQLTWEELSVCTDADEDGILNADGSSRIRAGIANNCSMTAEQCRLHTPPVWAAAASMDASLLGDCWGSLAIACPHVHMPRQPQQQGIVAMDTPGRRLAWDELSVCTDADDDGVLNPDVLSTCMDDDEQNRRGSFWRPQDRVFGASIVALASTVLRAVQYTEYPTTQAIVKHATLTKLRTNLHSIIPKLVIIAEYADYANTPALDAALGDMYAQLRSANRLVKAVYGYPARQVKIFYAAWMRERCVIEEIRRRGLTRSEFIRECMPLHWS